MYLLKLYDIDFGYVTDVLLFQSEENVKAKAEGVLRPYVDEHMKPYDDPEDYGCNSWEDYIKKEVDSWMSEGIFMIEQIEFSD